MVWHILGLVFLMVGGRLMVCGFLCGWKLVGGWIVFDLFFVWVSLGCIYSSQDGGDGMTGIPRCLAMGWHSWMRAQRSCLSARRVCPAFVVVVSAPVGALVGAWSWWDKEDAGRREKGFPTTSPFSGKTARIFLRGLVVEVKRANVSKIRVSKL